MSFAAPFFLAAGAGAAMVVVALHFLARQRPRAVPFPTARFIPERTARAPSRAVRPSDLLLLAMRVAALVLLGAAFARPVWRPSLKGTVRVVAVDRSRAVRRASEARDSALALLRDGDRLVLFDSASREIASAPRDSLGRLAVVPAAGSLSAALIAARRAGAAASGADSLELVVVSPLAQEEWDAATAAIRAQWPGRARLVRVARAEPAALRATVEIRGAAGDPLVTAGYAASRVPQAVRVVRGALLPSDSAWAAGDGGVLVHWPARFDGPPADSSGAVAFGTDVVVAPFERRGALSGDGATVLARWADGAPAATERPAGAAGCIREVAIPVPVAGDLVLRESVRRLGAALLAPCGGARGADPLGDTLVAALRAAGPLAAGAAIAPAGDDVSALVPWLLVAAAALLIAEMAVRRRTA